MADKPHHPLNVRGEPRAFFGRRSGKRLHSGQERLFRENLPSLEIVLGETMLTPGTLFRPEPSHIVLEIGYGGGEHLIRQALTHPRTGYIGCEVFSGGVAKLVDAVVSENIPNIRLFTDDALKLLAKLPDASIDGVYLLYPDPWPKLRHHKRRFVSPVTLGEIARVLKPGALFRFATDIEDYANWTLAYVLREPRFSIQFGPPGAWHNPWEGWMSTRYENKARAEGRLLSFYFDFLRI